MLMMTIHSYIKEPKRPVVFVPFYFGYEKLIEGDSFIQELGGAAKSKESLFGLLRSINALRENFGKVYVNVGESIELDPMLDRLEPTWRDREYENEDRPQWVGDVVDELGAEIMQRINSAAAVTPISLLAFALLATPKQKIGAAELRRQLKLSIDLLRRFSFFRRRATPDTITRGPQGAGFGQGGEVRGGRVLHKK